MSLFGQIKSILNKNGTQPLGKEYPPSSPIDRRRSRRFSHTGRRILVVDDSALVRSLLASGAQPDAISAAQSQPKHSNLKLV